MTTNTDGSHIVVDDWNERDAKKRASNNWRASLVPAAAVIPAPRVYIKAVAIKTLVVYIVVVCLCVAILFHGFFLEG